MGFYSHWHIMRISYALYIPVFVRIPPTYKNVYFPYSAMFYAVITNCIQKVFLLRVFSPFLIARKHCDQLFQLILSLREKCPYLELFWSAFSAFGLNTERYFVPLRIRFKCRKIQTRITPNMHTFYAVYSIKRGTTFILPEFYAHCVLFDCLM